MRPSLISTTRIAFAAAAGFTLAALAALTALVAPAVARADQTALETIAGLEASGYTVNVDRVGSAPIEDCVVTSVRNPQTQTRLLRDYSGRRDEDGNRDYDLIEVVVSRSISVSLDCSG